MADSVITQTISTTDANVTVGCQDNPLVSIEVSGTWAGTLNIETNLDPDNPIWRAGKVFTEANIGASASITGNGRWIIQAAGVGQVRARLNPATSGAAVVTLRAGDNETFGLSGGGGGGGGAATIADGADIAQGTTTDAPITTLTSAAAATAIALWKGIVNLLIQPVMAIAHGANPTAVAAGSRSPQYANRAGVPFVIGGHPNIKTICSNFTTAQTDQAIVTVATGLKIVVTRCKVHCSNANTVNVSYRVGFGTATVPAYGNTGLLESHPNCGPGGGSGSGGGTGIIGTGADDEDIRFTCSVPTGGTGAGVDVILSYYTIES